MAISALSRLKHGFDSRRGHQLLPRRTADRNILSICLKGTFITDFVVGRLLDSGSIVPR